MNVYMDDVRPGPDIFDEDWDKWVVVRSVENVKILLNLIDDLSLDHDMGDNHETGYDLVKWMAENQKWPEGITTIHSQHPVGAQQMKGVIDRYR